MGIGAAVRIAKKGMKERIADFVNPILKSKGKVSLKEIASHVKMNASIVEKEYLKLMIQEGYFEDTRFESGWLVRDVAPCPYCSEPVKLTEKKCPNCGATIKK
jgi:Holliday junction resolvasome RuvABC ATP-dependent DNA helicase subunit